MNAIALRVVRHTRNGVPIARGIEDTPWSHRSFGVDDPNGLRIRYYDVLEGGVVTKHGSRSGADG